MATDKVSNNSRQVYEKPLLRTIELVAEEVLGVGCKTASQGNPISPSSCIANSCSTLGS